MGALKIAIKGLPPINFPEGTTKEAALEIVRKGVKDGSLEVAAGLPMDAQSRQARAEMWGGEGTWYSGSTHDITEFDGSLANPLNDWGRGSYASNTVDEVSQNYAGVGPDLTARIDQTADQVADWLYEMGPEERAETLAEYGLTPEDYEEFGGSMAVREIAT